MLLTKLWASILAVLATAFLAGMFLLSLGTPGGFSDADRAAIRAVTEAGLAAVHAEIQSSPVQRAPALLKDSRLAAALKEEGDGREDDPDYVPLEQVLADVAEEALLADFPQMTVGIVGGENQVLAASGIAKALLEQAAASPAAQAAPKDGESLWSATLGGRLHVVKLSRPNELGHRVIALQPLPTGAGSLLRRILGTKNPAGLVRDGKLLGDLIGDLQVGPQIERLAQEHAGDAPEDGASKVFRVGRGLDARIGAIGRVPGPAGEGPDGTMLVVLSRNTAAAGQRHVADALQQAVDAGQLGQLGWPVLGAILIIGVGLAWYLPQVEVESPLRRLAGELEAVAQGQQHHVFHDRYGGPVGRVARAAAAAQEAIHAAYMTAQDDEEGEAPAPAPRPKTRSRRAVTRSHRRAGSRRHKALEQPEAAASPGAAGAPGAIDLPEDDGPAEVAVERHSHADAPAAPPLEDGVPAEAEAPELAASLMPDQPPAPPPEPEPEDPREAYFREIYEEFVQVKETCGEATESFTFEKFAVKLRKNTAQLLERPGVTDVKFTVYVKDGKAALKAKVVKG